MEITVIVALSIGMILCVFFTFSTVAYAVKLDCDVRHYRSVWKSADQECKDLKKIIDGDSAAIELLTNQLTRALEEIKTLRGEE